MRVLIVKVSALGDVIHALPVLDYLHRVMPGIEIDWVVEEPFRDVLEGNPLISRLHVVRTRVWRKRPFAAATRREIGELKTALRERAYDLVFDIQGNLKSGLVSWLSGAGNRIGFTRDYLQESINLIFTTRQIPPRSQDYHITDQYLRLVSVPFGRDFKEIELCSDIHTSPEDDAAAETLLSTLADGLVFLFHFGTTWQTKFWFEAGWIELGKSLLGRFPESSILLSWGNEEERKTVTAMAAAIGTGARVIDRYPLKGLAALLKKVDLVVGGDTGPVHMAAAVGTPTVSLYRASDGKRSGPRGKRQIIIQSPLPCAGCFRTRCDQDAACRESITVEKVLQGIGKLFG
ncbi:MAG: heptosyltransferase [Geobacteraceae bacterium]|nr:MAG: heptosyltransferase [Geobacteraceae bacterium]